MMLFPRLRSFLVKLIRPWRWFRKPAPPPAPPLLTVMTPEQALAAEMHRIIDRPGGGTLTIREYGHWAPPAEQDWHIPCVVDNSRFEAMLLKDADYRPFAEKLLEEKTESLTVALGSKEAAVAKLPTVDELAAELKAVETLPPGVPHEQRLAMLVFGVKKK